MACCYRRRDKAHRCWYRVAALYFGVHIETELTKCTQPCHNRFHIIPCLLSSHVHLQTEAQQQDTCNVRNTVIETQQSRVTSVELSVYVPGFPMRGTPISDTPR